jgi:hypothetical protein
LCKSANLSTQAIEYIPLSICIWKEILRTERASIFAVVRDLRIESDLDFSIVAEEDIKILGKDGCQ